MIKETYKHFCFKRLIVSYKVDNFWVELKQGDYSTHTSSAMSVHHLVHIPYSDFSLLLLLTHMMIS